LVETAAAVILLTGLAFAAPGGRSAPVPVESSTLTRWTPRALPVLAKLINDSTAIENGTDPASVLAPALPRNSAADYAVDLAAAQRLTAPPDPGLAQAWRSMLRQLAAAAPDLETIAHPDQAAMTRTHLRFAAVNTVLLEFQQAIRPAR
jgi:hypothetical protein